MGIANALKINLVTSLVLLAICLCSPAYPADVSVSAYVNKEKVALGDTLLLTVTVHGSAQASQPQIPSLEGFRILSTSTSTRLVTGTAGFQSEVSFVYALQPIKLGSLEIPPITVAVAGDRYSTQPLTVEVLKAATPPPTPGRQPDAADLGTKLFLRASADTASAYVGQPIVLTLQLCWAGVRIDSPSLSHIEADGFRIIQLGQPAQTFKPIDGINCNVLEVTYACFPLMPGNLSIGPFSVTCGLLVPRQGRSASPRLLQDFFSDDFDFFFGGYQRKAVRVSADALAFDVKPLPQTGKPEGFSGAVGKFEVAVDVTPTEVSVGDGITLTMNVRGEGDLESAAAALIRSSEALKAFPPEVSFETLPAVDRFHSQKTFKQLVVIQRDDIAELPGVAFSYFDPALEDYVTVSKGPFPIAVAVAPGPTGGIAAGTLPKAGVRLLSRGLFGIRTDVASLAKPHPPLYSSPLLLGFIVALPALGASFAFVISRRIERLRFDSAYARASRARKKALLELRKPGASDIETCFTVARALSRFVADRLNLSPAAVTAASLARLLEPAGVSRELVAKTSAVLSACDRGRFSGAASTSKETQNLPAAARKLIVELDKAIRKT